MTHSRKIATSVGIAALVVMVFGAGAVVGTLRLPPIPELIALVGQTQQGSEQAGEAAYAGDVELLRFAFTQDLLKGQLIHPPIRDLEGLRRAVSSMLLPTQSFPDAYDRIRVVGAGLVPGRLTDRVLAVEYRLAGRNYVAHAYMRAAEVAAGERVALVIPGSGHNTATGIYLDDPASYHHGIIGALEPEHDVFILIKPNEDVLAFHDGEGKLSPDFYLARLLNAGGSYSGHYIANALAIIRHLETTYPELILAGLSQGGLATLLAALQSEPDAAIVASGYSVLDVTWAGFDQVLIPGLERWASPDAVRSRIGELRTRFLFTYGRAGVGTYRIEAEEGPTCAFLASLDNVRCGAHQGGHIFPEDRIRDFLGAGESDPQR